MLEINQIFDGKYKIVSILGRGGMSVVYKAQNITLGNYWAIKQVSKTVKGREVDYLAEPNILKLLNHPMLPRIIDIKEDVDCVYVVMDFIEGESMDKLLQRKKRFPEAEVIRWAKDICSVLEYLHGQKPSPIIYRDMKPANLMLDDKGGIKIIDFGIARQFKEESHTDTTIMGTRGYAAPEQYGKNQSDARTDIYSLGVTLYHLLTGISPNDPPYEIRPLREIDKGFSRGMEYIIAKCTQNDPATRYRNVRDLLDDLNNIYKYDEGYKKLQKKRNILFTVFVLLYLGFGAVGYWGFRMVDADLYAQYQSCFAAAAQDMSANRFADAGTAIDQAIALKPRYIDGYLEKAKWYYMQQRYEECIAYIDANLYEHTFSTATYSEARFAEAMYIKGISYLGMGDPYSAAFYCKQSTEYDPANASYFRDYAIACAKDGDVETAGAALNTAQKLGAAGDDVSLIMAEIYIETGETGKAEEQLRQLIDDAQSSAARQKAYLTLSELYASIGRETQRIETLEEGLKREDLTDDPLLLEQLASAYSMRAKESSTQAASRKYYRAAAERFEKLLAMGYDRFYLLNNLAVVYQNMDNMAQAERVMLQAVDLYPEDYRPYLRLVFIRNQMCKEVGILDRDYSQVQEHYLMAETYYTMQLERTGKEDPDMTEAARLIQELQDKGWL